MRYKGRDLIQCTGRFNYRKLTDWVREKIGGNVDFEENPELLTNKSWIGVSVVWYFLTTRNLLEYCRAGNIEMVTRRVNGGLNGYKDRLEWYDATALVMLGYGSIKEAQADLNLQVDGISGPKTRAAMHYALSQLEPVTIAPKSGGLADIITAILAAFGKAKK